MQSIDAASLKTGEVRQAAWSYHAWPTHKAGVAYRYLDPFFQRSDLWQDLFNEYQARPALLMIAQGQINLLSPIEKYEYLIGNMDFSLTKEEWRKGQTYLSAYGEIPTWIGICHGTSPASLNSLRPAQSITLKSADQQSDIVFYTADIKALVSYAWATSGGASSVMGARCESVMGSGTRATQNCLDTNPGSFHLAVVNLIGVHELPFIMDSFAGREVWNRAVVAYRYNYFRPGTRNHSDSLQHALVARRDLPNDPYAKFRSPRATHILGVTMELTYMIGIPANDQNNGPESDVTDKSTYSYDLELDAEGNIVGGEWQSIFHPDFLWVVAKNYRPRTLQDDVIGDGLTHYTGRQVLPEAFQAHGREAARKNELLYSVLEAMVRLSQPTAPTL